MGLVENLSPNIVKDEPSLGDVRVDLDLEVKFGSYVHPRMIMFADHATWRYLMLKKGLHLVYL